METAPEGTPLYVHLPFCAAKCPYCDFFSVAGLRRSCRQVNSRGSPTDSMS